MKSGIKRSVVLLGQRAVTDFESLETGFGHRCNKIQNFL